MHLGALARFNLLRLLLLGVDPEGFWVDVVGLTVSSDFLANQKPIGFSVQVFLNLILGIAHVIL